MSNTVHRTRGRVSLAATAAVLAAAAALHGPAAHAQPATTADDRDCEIETLPIPEGRTFTFVTGMSDDGSIVLYRTYADDPNNDWTRHPLIYSDGETTEVEMDGTDQKLADVNNAGTIVASAYLDEGQVPYVLEDGELTRLPGGNGEVNAINEHGDAVGALIGETDLEPVLWPAGADEPTPLPIPDSAAWGSAVGITDDGTVIGYHSDMDWNSTPYMWDAEGNGSALPLPEGVAADASAHPEDASGEWVTGHLDSPQDGIANGVRWNLAEGTAEVLDINSAYAVTADGTVGGQIGLAGEYNATAGIESPEAGLVELPGVVPGDDNWFGDAVTALSADGSVIAGHVYTGEGEWGHLLNAVLWNCG